jgi:DNA-binding MltR family transcriptional regulator
MAEKLLSTNGLLGAFGARANCAYAFGFINKVVHQDLGVIIEIRNHFAHHPLDATFDGDKIPGLVEKLSHYNPGRPRRDVYVMTCAVHGVGMLAAISGAQARGDE